MNNQLTVAISKSLEGAWFYAQFNRLSLLQRKILVPLLIGFITGILILTVIGLCLLILGTPFILSYLASEIFLPNYPLILK